MPPSSVTLSNWNPEALPSMWPSLMKLPTDRMSANRSRRHGDPRTCLAALSATLTFPINSSLLSPNSSLKSMAPSQLCSMGISASVRANFSAAPSFEGSPLCLRRYVLKVLSSSSVGIIPCSASILSGESTVVSMESTAALISSPVIFLSSDRRNWASAMPIFCARFMSNRVTFLSFEPISSLPCDGFFFFFSFLAPGSSHNNSSSARLSSSGTFLPPILLLASQIVS
mmetsp:Transcript_8738/g.21284  ORF Transcript_8738/g.21284 Transcript_8738/m.21284 type:complete len:228 (-) Transcript_8738:72-755(-)